MLLSISFRVVGVVSVIVELEAGDLGSGSSEGCLGYGLVDGGGCGGGGLIIGSGSLHERYWHGGCGEGRGCPCGSSGSTSGYVHVNVHVGVGVGVDMTGSDDCLRKQEHGDHRR